VLLNSRSFRLLIDSLFDSIRFDSTFFSDNNQEEEDEKQVSD